VDLVTLDFETYYDEHYMLKKLTTEAYIRDPRFEAHGAAIHFPLAQDKAAGWHDRKQLPLALGLIDWKNTACMCWHGHFDGLILSHHYGVRPAFWIDPMLMARALLGPHVSVSLDSVRKLFKLPAKHTPYHLFRGKHWGDIPEYDRKLIAEGAIDETKSIFRIYELLADKIPAEEFQLMDMTIRMFTEPVLSADVEMLGWIWMDAEAEKQELLAQLDLAPMQIGKRLLNAQQQIGSTKAFEQLLVDAGIDVEYKPGKKKKDGSPGKQVAALAKTDIFMQSLLEHEDPYVVALACARLGVKSTLNQSRAERLGDMANRGLMTPYLSYCAALTKRWGGGDKTNWQNWPRVEKSNKFYLRQAIHIKNKYIAKADASQIECRLLNFCAGQDDIIQAFRDGRDLYAEQATDFYGYKITKETFPIERQVGKVLELQCGFGSGGERIRFTLRNADPPVIISKERGIEARDSYRRRHPMVVGSWRLGDKLIPVLASGDSQEVPGRWPLHIADRCVWLPNGLPLNYTTLEWHKDEEGDQFWRVDCGKREGSWRKLYGSRLVENWVQALARVHVGQVAVRLRDAGYRPLMTEHDSLAYEMSDGLADLLEAEMSRAPDWLPGIPLKCEVKVQRCLG
jgi:DNA polymerase I-like protein with 3'-5' exonuclease and polymerase domains